MGGKASPLHDLDSKLVGFAESNSMPNYDYPDQHRNLADPERPIFGSKDWKCTGCPDVRPILVITNANIECAL